MDILNSIADFLANPWVGRALAVLFAAAGIFLKYKLTNVKKVLDEIRDLASSYKKAKDPKGEGGEKITDAEQEAIQKEAIEVLAAIGEILAKKTP